MKQDLIFSRAASDSFLTRADVARMAPAAFSETAADHLSTRYGQVTTAAALDVLADYGFQPVQAAQVRPRKASSAAHGHHLLAFSRTGEVVEADGFRPEIVLYNSHDGQSALKLFAGAFRFICSNGIVAGEGFQAKLRHTTGTANGFEDMLRDTAGRLPDLMGRIEDMRSTTVDPEQALEFAYNAATLRWEMMPEEKPEIMRGSFADDRTIQNLLSVRRREDEGLDAWTIFNKVQEHVIRGGAVVRSYTDKYPDGRARKSRPLGSVPAVVSANRDLWDMAETAFDLPESAPYLLAAE